MLSSSGVAVSDSVRRRPRPSRRSTACSGRCVGLADVAGEQRAGQLAADRRGVDRRDGRALRRHPDVARRAAGVAGPGHRQHGLFQLPGRHRQHERARPVAVAVVGPDLVLAPGLVTERDPEVVVHVTRHGRPPAWCLSLYESSEHGG